MAEDAHILVVDDDARLRALLSRYLAGEGFRVTTAETATEARDKLRFMHPDMLVLDVMMPGESGLTLTELLRREPGIEVPVLLLTARGSPEDRIAGFEAGADDYLPKPFEPRELVLRIRALLRRAPAPVPEAPQRPVPLGALAFDVERGELSGPEGVVRLTGGEAALLASARAQAERGAVARGDRRGARNGRGRRAGDRRAGDAAAPQGRGRSARAALPAHGAGAWLCAEAGCIGAWTPSRPCTVCGGSAFRHLTSEDGYDWEVCEHCDFVRLTSAFTLRRTGRHPGRNLRRELHREIRCEARQEAGPLPAAVEADHPARDARRLSRCRQQLRLHDRGRRTGRLSRHRPGGQPRPGGARAQDLPATPHSSARRWRPSIPAARGSMRSTAPR